MSALREGSIDVEKENEFFLSAFFTFEEYMNAVLYDPLWGFYGSGKVKFGADFNTMPVALSPVFAEMMAERFFSMYTGMLAEGSLSNRGRFSVLEFGAGTGVFARDMVAYCLERSRHDERWRDFYRQLEYVIGERSRALITKQSSCNSQFLGSKIRILEADAQNMNGFLTHERPIKGVIFSNELLDVFPAHRIVARGNEEPRFVVSIPSIIDGLTDTVAVQNVVGREILVPAKTTMFRFLDEVLGPAGLSIESLRHKSGAYSAASPAIRRLAAEGAIILCKEDFLKIQTLLSGPGMNIYRERMASCMRFHEALLPVEMLPELHAYLKEHKQIQSMLERAGAGLALSFGWKRFIREAASIIDKGYVFTIDDGYTAAEFVTTGPQGSPVMVYHHRLDSRGCNPYMAPGDADVCASVDFTALVEEGMQHGLRPVFYGRLSALEDGLPVAIHSEDSIYRIKEHFRRSAVEMNLEPWLLAQSGLRGEKAGYFGQAVREYLDGRPDKAEALDSASKDLMAQLLQKASEDAEQRVPMWIKAFGQMHRILIQQKESTDPRYVFSRKALPLS
jgi:SAM-dependent MidA family methyltransferase